MKLYETILLHISPVCILNLKHTMHAFQTDVGMISVLGCLLRKRKTGCWISEPWNKANFKL